MNLLFFIHISYEWLILPKTVSALAHNKPACGLHGCEIEINVCVFHRTFEDSGMTHQSGGFSSLIPVGTRAPLAQICLSPSVCSRFLPLAVSVPIGL